ncbi:hypothetical protein DMP23_21440 [Amycolatopsis sp. A1MSW2902]
MRARAAAHVSWSRTTDRAARTAPARKAALDRFERMVDPEGVMDDATRQKQALAAKRAYFQRLAYRSSRARGRTHRAQQDGRNADG